MPEMVFEVHEVTYCYQGVTALDGLSLTVARGQRIALMGANGSGKSTLLRMLAALIFPAKGLVTFCGESLTEQHFEDANFSRQFRRRVGLVFQNPDVQLFSPTVFEEVAFGPLQLAWPKEKIRAQVGQMLEMLKISHLKDRSPHQLSTGEKKRVAMASVLILDPEVLLLDEPTAALDPGSASQMIDSLIGLRGGTKTVIATTHDLDIVEDIADHCLVLKDGRVAAGGPPTEILSQTALLEHTSLLHAHRHLHPSGVIHSHPHLHSHEH